MNDEMLIEKRISGEKRFEGKIVDIECDSALLPDGKTAYREVVRKIHNGVCVVPLTDDGNVVIVRQYRYPYAEILPEAPAGKSEKGESPEECAVRELSEETGYTAEKLIPLGEFYPSPGIMDEVLYLYAATGLTKGQTHPDEDEFVEASLVPLEKMVEQIMNGEIRDGKTQTAILKTYLKKQRGEL